MPDWVMRLSFLPAGTGTICVPMLPAYGRPPGMPHDLRLLVHLLASLKLILHKAASQMRAGSLTKWPTTRSSGERLMGHSALWYQPWKAGPGGPSPPQSPPKPSQWHGSSSSTAGKLSASGARPPPPLPPAPPSSPDPREETWSSLRFRRGAAGGGVAAPLFLLPLLDCPAAWLSASPTCCCCCSAGPNDRLPRPCSRPQSVLAGAVLAGAASRGTAPLWCWPARTHTDGCLLAQMQTKMPHQISTQAYLIYKHLGRHRHPTAHSIASRSQGAH